MPCQSPPDHTADEVVARLLDKFARDVCRAPGFSRGDFDDVRQDLVVALLKAHRSFNPKLGSWRALAKTALKHAAAGLIRDRHTKSRRLLHRVGLPEEPTVPPTELLAADVTNVIASLTPALRQFTELLTVMPLTEIWREHVSRRKAQQYLAALRSAFQRGALGL